MGRRVTTDTLSINEARAIALVAQGFGKRSKGQPTQRDLSRVFDDVGLIQIDSVNVLVRSQELPLFARLGAHPRSLIPDAHAKHKLFEYWGHAASHVPVDQHRLFRWRMDAAKRGETWGGIAEFGRTKRAFIKKIHAYVSENGPIAAGEISTRTEPKGTWWDWDDAKIALEYLFWTGELTARRRTRDFARLYDIPERMIPAEHLNAATPSIDDAHDELMERTLRHLGVATATDIADYHHVKVAAVKSALARLIEAQKVQTVSVEGWPQPAYVLSSLKVPSSDCSAMSCSSLLSPFDSLVWCRPRIERLFGFNYRIEIYVPAPKRVYGYYVLPFLMNGELVGRFDLKADRHASTLLVQASHIELACADRSAHVADAAATELRLMARWLQLERIETKPRGTLAKALTKSLA